MQCFCSDVMTVSCALVQLVVILAVSHIAIQCCTCSSLIEPYPANLAKRQRHVLHTKPTWIYSSPALPEPMMTNQVAIVSTTSSLISIALHFHPVIFFSCATHVLDIEAICVCLHAVLTYLGKRCTPKQCALCGHPYLKLWPSWNQFFFRTHLVPSPRILLFPVLDINSQPCVSKVGNKPHFTLHFTLHTVHSALYTHTSHFTLYALHYTLYTPHFTLHIPHFALRPLPHSRVYCALVR